MGVYLFLHFVSSSFLCFFGGSCAPTEKPYIYILNIYNTISLYTTIYLYTKLINLLYCCKIYCKLIFFFFLGIHGSRYVTTHGIALNCDVDLDWFSHIVPCGIEGKEVTSLSRELLRKVTVKETLPKFLDSFQKHFPCEYKYCS